MKDHEVPVPQPEPIVLFARESVLAFASPAELLFERQNLLAWSIAASVSEAPTLDYRQAVSVRVGAAELGTLHVECVHLEHGYAGLVVHDRRAVVETLLARAESLMPSSSTRIPYGDPSGSEPPVELLSVYALINPASPAGILGIPLLREPTPDEHARPSTPLLLRWIYGSPGLRQLTFEMGGPTLSLVAIGGHEVALPRPLKEVASVLAEPTGSCTIGAGSEIGEHFVRTRALLVEVLRALFMRFPDPELLTALAPHRARFARLTPLGRNLLPSLASSLSQQRDVWTLLNGKTPFDRLTKELPAALLLLLELHKGIDWAAVPAPPRLRGKKLT